MVLAPELGAEICSVDSMLVYRGMDVGTAKPSPADRAAVPHHLLDLAEPSERFTVARFQELARMHGITVVDDYAHHPTEIRATLSAARAAYPSNRLIAVFQPHLYSRTRDFATDFGAALAGADLVWVTDVYAAREAPLERYRRVGP